MVHSLYADRILSETQALSLMRAGGILLFPTETLYAIGTNCASLSALAAICALKDRPPNKPLPLAAADCCQVHALCRTESCCDALFALWPAPLTVILPLREPASLPLCVQNAQGEVAIRVSPHPIVRALAAYAPITVSSANRAGCPPARGLSTLDPALCAGIAESGLPWGMLAGSVGRSSLPSTIVRPQDGAIRVLRTGVFPLNLLREAGFSLLPET
ncbi:MAG: Sua5/YciO/YrdC/YwlC family protein [Desulfovibrionaceae bacterium]|nr:Sua5/YciO/YrdC/YwlC family protein [Desulfovibrionaceae bacterium]